VRAALLDLRVLTLAYGVPVAGWTGPWWSPSQRSLTPPSRS